jgi:hypothetical protein
MVSPIPVPGLPDAEVDPPVAFAPLRCLAELRLAPEQFALICAE